MIEKLPLGWKDFKNYLKHKRKEMKMEDLIIRLCIEEDNRNAEKKKWGVPTWLRLMSWNMTKPLDQRRSNLTKGPNLGLKVELPRN